MSWSRRSTPPTRPWSANCRRKTVLDGMPRWFGSCGRGRFRDVTQEPIPLPGIPVSAGALIYDRARRLLILKPTYKSGWTIPGGVMEADGETPWEACRREVREECGLDVRNGRLACVDFRTPRPDRPGKPGNPGGIRVLFDC